MIVCYFDGCCAPKNPGGYAGYGIIILKDGQRVLAEGKFIGHGDKMSNNVSEYTGFMRILTWLINNKSKKDIAIIKGDSKLVINQMFGTWKIKQGLYKPIAVQCLAKLKHLTNITGKWIPREDNHLCDQLSKRAIYNKQLSDGIRLS